MAKAEYTVHNFDPSNKAIQQEVEKQNTLNELVLEKKWLTRAITFGVILGSIALFILLLVVAWKIWNFTQESHIVNDSIQGSKLTTERLEQQKNQSLDSLSKKVEFQPMVQTQFTVFRETIIESGDKVVTGLTYIPEDLRTPVKQYCYMEGEGLSGIPLAEVDHDGKVKVVADEQTYSSIIHSYCLFSLNE